MLAFIYSRCDVLRDFINSINVDVDVDVESTRTVDEVNRQLLLNARIQKVPFDL